MQLYLEIICNVLNCTKTKLRIKTTKYDKTTSFVSGKSKWLLKKISGGFYIRLKVGLVFGYSQKYASPSVYYTEIDFFYLR